jgi:alpha-L-fucosidase 2
MQQTSSLASRVLRMTRRTFMGAGAALSVAPRSLMAQGPASRHSDNRLWYRQPASQWEEALPIGNGRLGAMVFGRVAQERLQLNEDTLWAGSPYVPDSPEAYEALAEVRRLIAEGEYKQASDLAGAKMMARPLRQMPYGTLGDLLVDFANFEVPADYERSLDLGTAIASTQYRTSAGRIRREVFASAPDQLVVMSLEGSKGSIDLDLSYRGPREVRQEAADYSGGASDTGPIPPPEWSQKEEPGELHETIAIQPDGADAWLITGRNESAENIPSGLRFAIRARLLSDGEVEVHPGGVSLRGATRATLLVAAATSYVNHENVDGDPIAQVRRQTDAGAVKTFADLRRDHIRAHQDLFDTLSIDLGRTPAAEKPTDERIRGAESADDPALAALYAQYGRYLLISSSRPGTQPANLQGIWNDDISPPWGSKYTININTEMNYWLADPANLGICFEPLLKMVEALSVKGARTAKTMYRARGWVAHHNTDLWRASAPIDGPEWGLWPLGGAWLCTTLWDHWDYSRDETFLRRLYPLMRDASLFFLDTLVEDPEGGGLVTSPSLSPENQHPFGSSVCAGPAMDRQILRDLFDRTVDAGNRLGVDADLLTQFAEARARLPADRIGKAGQLQEWLEDWDTEAPEQQHRHVSHLYAVYPSDQINVRDTPELADAAKVTLDTRGDKSTGWATAWRLCLWARLGNGERAHSILRGLLGPERTYPNMFDAHPPFQIDGNFGGTAGILSMLLQDWGGELTLLPALPKEWPEGSLVGARARGNLLVDLHWRDGKPAKLLIKGPPGQPVRIRHSGAIQEITLNSSGAYAFSA